GSSARSAKRRSSPRSRSGHPRRRPSTPSTSSSNIRCRNCCMLCRAKLSSVSQVGLDAATDSVLFFLTGGVSFCSGVDRARGSFGEPKVTPPFLVYTLSDVTSAGSVRRTRGQCSFYINEWPPWGKTFTPCAYFRLGYFQA